MEVIQIFSTTIEQLADKVISHAVKSDASDIHITPRKNDYHLQLRVANELIPYLKLRKEECDRLVSHFKFSASMDIGERRRPQSGAYSCFVDGQLIGLRLSTLPSTYSESLVIRLLPQYEKIPFSEISLFPASTRKLLSLLKHSHGLILFTGPTGSGKTTTLYSLINESSRIFNRHVITLEDPIEKNTENFLQVQVNEKAGITYATGLKAILRHDPDLIMVGEIRDAETAEIAIRAALTGHLVLSSMHTRDTRGAIYRLLEFGVKMPEIEQSLIAVTAQRLVELTCPICHQQTCSTACSSKGKRASVFEVLSGKSLTEVISEAKGKQVHYDYPKLKDMIKKGIALGFIKESEYERWVYADE